MGGRFPNFSNKSSSRYLLKMNTKPTAAGVCSECIPHAYGPMLNEVGASNVFEGSLHVVGAFLRRMLCARGFACAGIPATSLNRKSRFATPFQAHAGSVLAITAS